MNDLTAISAAFAASPLSRQTILRDTMRYCGQEIARQFETGDEALKVLDAKGAPIVNKLAAAVTVLISLVKIELLDFQRELARMRMPAAVRADMRDVARLANRAARPGA